MPSKVWTNCTTWVPVPGSTWSRRSWRASTSAADSPSIALLASSQALATSTALPLRGPDSVRPRAGVSVRGVPNRASQVARAPGLALTTAATASACALVGFTRAPARLSVVDVEPGVSAVAVTAAALDENVRPAIAAAAVATARTWVLRLFRMLGAPWRAARVAGYPRVCDLNDAPSSRSRVPGRSRPGYAATVSSGRTRCCWWRCRSVDAVKSTSASQISAKPTQRIAGIGSWKNRTPQQELHGRGEVLHQAQRAQRDPGRGAAEAEQRDHGDHAGADDQQRRAPAPLLPNVEAPVAIRNTM